VSVDVVAVVLFEELIRSQVLDGLADDLSCENVPVVEVDDND